MLSGLLLRIPRGITTSVCEALYIIIETEDGTSEQERLSDVEKDAGGDFAQVEKGEEREAYRCQDE